jgi:hypothetical protein
MKTQHDLAPRGATIDLDDVRPEGRRTPRRSGLAAATGAILAIALAACSPSATTAPIGSAALPSINPSAVASAAAGAALTALDQVDAAISANQASNALTADEATSLTQMSAGVRTALTSGDMTAARTAVQNLSTKVDGFASKLTGPAGTQLTAAIAALKSALPAS